MATTDIPASSLTRELTLNVRITRIGVLRFRIWLACRIIKLAASVLGCSINVEVLDEQTT